MNDRGASELRSQAARCRRLADAISDVRTRDILTNSAEEFENEARARDSVEGQGPAGEDEG